MIRWPTVLITLFVIGTVTTVAGAADTAWSVESFNRRKPDWDQLVGATIRMEGRVSLLGGGQIRLIKCEVPIRAPETMTRSVRGRDSIEVTGHLKRDNNRLVIEADRIRVLPSDLKEFDSRTARLRMPKPSEWYDIGDWALERSTFYDDEELAKKATSAFEHGVNIEWRGLDAADAAGRFELAQKVARYNLPEPLRMELIHEGDRILWTTAARTTPLDKEVVTKLLAKLVEDLPGASQPLASIKGELKDRYDREPLSAYRDSAEDVRVQLHRFFYTSVQLTLILEDAAKDGRNGDEIAMRIDMFVPEYRKLADQYRLQKLNWRLKQAAVATRPEIVQLAAEFRARSLPDQATKALTRWVKAQEPRLRQDGALGLLQLADEQLSLLQDERSAVALLVEANKRDPTFADVTDKLKSLGYSNIGGTWTRMTPAIPLTPVPEVNTTLPGAVAVGMNATAARDAMGGDANSIARVLTRGGVTEVWSYGVPGSSRLIIRLEGTRLTPDLRVVEIANER
ncbi:MAG: hypothetical protein JSS49_07720 [Planctomycetes bacterium]|nr:hypothetical protein [Planctomycetota bacterium]